MTHYRLLIPLFASLTAAAGCTQTECATGTIERDGKCEPATTTNEPADCGPGTVLQGDICVPKIAPTICDPTTTMAVQGADGTITCIGTGGGDCGSPIPCMAPTGGKLTICGQIYDFETGTKFQDGGGMSTASCDPSAPASSGPCALQILVVDAIAFGTNPAMAAMNPLPTEGITIDKCGRYRVAGIDTNGTGPFIGLGFDDAGQPLGPGGVTVTVGVAAPKSDGPLIQGFEGFVTPATTAGKWQASGGPPLANGIYAAVFRKHKKGNGDPLENQAGAQITKGSAIQTNVSGNCGSQQCAYYFTAAETSRQTVDPAATLTGANGTSLVTKAAVSESAAYGGAMGLGTGCRWDTHAAASLPGIVFIQVFRKIDLLGQTCAD